MDIGQNLRYRKYRKVLEITLSFPLLVGNLFQLHHPQSNLAPARIWSLSSLLSQNLNVFHLTSTKLQQFLKYMH